MSHKEDGGKLAWRLLLTGPAFLAAKEVVRTLTWGAFERPRANGSKGYGADNWVTVEDAQARYFDAAVRHLVAFEQGESIDPDSGEALIHHLGSCACCIIFKLALDLKKRTQLDGGPCER